MNTQSPLSPRQADFLRFAAQGVPIKAISYSMGISEGAAKAHGAFARRKINARTTAQAVAIAVRAGWI